MELLSVNIRCVVCCNRRERSEHDGAVPPYDVMIVSCT